MTHMFQDSAFARRSHGRVFRARAGNGLGNVLGGNNDPPPTQTSATQSPPASSQSQSKPPQQSSAPPTPPATTTTPVNPVADKPPASTTTQTVVNTPPPASKTNTQSTSQSTSSSGSSSSTTTSNSNTASLLDSAPSTLAPGVVPTFSGLSTPSFDTDSLTLTSDSSSPTSSADASGSSSSSGTTKVIGIAAGAIVGVAVLIALVSFIVKRCTRKKYDDALGEAFDRNEFNRHSMRLPDDDGGMLAPTGSSHGHGSPNMQESRGPRPPTMIARHMNNFGADAYPAFPPMPPQAYHGQDGGGDYVDYGYTQQHQLAAHPHEFTQHDGTLFAADGSGMAESPVTSPFGDTFPQHGQDAFNPSGANYLNHQIGNGGIGNMAGVGRALTVRRTSSENGSAHGPISPPAPAHINNLEHLARGQSVTPYQAKQYAEISRRLVDQNGNVSEGPDRAYERLAREPVQAAYGAGAGQRGSVYDDADAYGGI